jgi:hypothetical protein
VLSVPAEADSELTFRLVDDPDLKDLGKGAFVINVVEGDGALVALTLCPEMQEKSPCRMATLRSIDGLEWDVTGEPLPRPGPYWGLVWTEDGFLFVLDDFEKSRQVVYRSDDGLTWDQLPVRGTDYLDAVSAGPGGYLGLGCDRYCERTLPFWSADGRRWTRDEGFTEKLNLTDVATSGDKLIAIGGIPPGDDQAVVAFTDGRWERLELPLPPAPDGSQVSITDVAALSDGGFAIVGAFERPNSTTGPFLLTSPDGEAWESSPVTLDLGVERLRAEPYAIAAGPGLLALEVILYGRGAKELGLRGASAIAWSTRADDWHLATLPLPSGAKDLVVRDLLVTDDGRVIVVGEIYRGRTNRAAVWVGSFEERTAPQATPEPTMDPTAVVTPAPEGASNSRAERARLEVALLAQAGYASCLPFRKRGEFDPFEFGASAAVRCDRPASGIEQVAVFEFLDSMSLDDYWSYRIDSFPTSFKRSDEACHDGEAGHATWAHGAVMCYVSSVSGKAKLRWTDERTDTYWVADANHRNVARLARWWRDDRP